MVGAGAGLGEEPPSDLGLDEDESDWDGEEGAGVAGAAVVDVCGASDFS